MDTFYVVLGFCLFAWVYAQPNPPPTNIFFDVGTGIFDGNTEIVTDDSNFRSLCSVGSTLYHTAGGNIYRNGSLFREGVGDIQAIACSCNFIATAYIDNNNDTIVNVTKLESSPSIIIKENLGSRGGVALAFFKNGTDSWLIVVSQSTLYKYDADSLTDGPVAMASNLSLSGPPRCVAIYLDSSTMLTYIFVSFNLQPGRRLTFNGDVLTESLELRVPGAVLFGTTFPGGLSCVAVEDEYIYFVVSLASIGTSSYELARYPITMYVPTLPTGVSRETTVVVASGERSIAVNSNANGLSVCGSSCQSTSACGANCSCSSACGVCFSGGNGQCQCSNSLQDNCCYSVSTLAATCIEQVPRVDAFCVVKNHVAMRRSGDPVDIVGVTRENLAEGMTLNRVVKTGRWRILSNFTTISRNDGSLTVGGNSFPVQRSARGRRFGLYAVSVKPVNQSLQQEWIPCIATERSGFLNKMFTATVSTDESVMLQATFNTTRLMRFLTMVTWRYTPVNSTSTNAMTSNVMPVGMPQCRGSLQCTVTGATGTAAYECYRPRRDPRTWHPVFFVSVRDCPAGKFGPTCNGTCPTCVNGVCDEDTGLCNCYPGFHGTDCNSSCSAGFIGRQCDISCGDVYSGCDDCENMLICPTGKVGCTCYPGFRPPLCNERCEPGRWGTNCMRTCASTPCDPRTGAAV